MRDVVMTVAEMDMLKNAVNDSLVMNLKQLDAYRVQFKKGEANIPFFEIRVQENLDKNKSLRKLEAKLYPDSGVYATYFKYV